MKKIVLILLFLAQGIVPYSLYSQVGFTCDSPIQVTSLPYQTVDNTANYGDTTDVSQPASCGVTAGNYMTGNDVFYAYTPSTSGTINVKMAPTANWSGLFVYEGCANVGVTCAAGIGNANSTVREIPLLQVVAGQTYIFVISTYATPQTVGYAFQIQNVNCAAPTGLVVNSVTENTATLSWDLNNSTSWEVKVQPANSGVPTTAGVVTSSNSGFVASGLSSGTAYEYWVRSSCGDSSFSSWTGPKAFNLSICPIENQCNYTFILSDSYGDGWNGNTMSVLQNGIVVDSIGSSFTTGSGPIPITVALCNGMPFELKWNTGGSFAYEVGISIQNSFGQTLYTKSPGSGSQGTILYSGTTNCLTPAVICSTPTGFAASEVSSTGATLSWTEVNNATQWEVLVVASQTTPPTAASVGIVTTVSPFAITGLLPNTSYDAYVRSICSDSLSSDWSAPVTFYTGCMTPTNIVISNQTSNSATIGWTSLSQSSMWEVLILPLTAPAPTDTTPGITTNTNPYYVTGLVPGNSYNFYVRTICNSNLVSSWSEPQVVTTILALPPLTTNSTQYSVNQLVTDVLINNPCVAISNITSSTGTNFGSVNGIGYFNNINPNFPITSGVVLTTGNAESVPGPNLSVLSGGNGSWTGDPQLEAIVTMATGNTMISKNATKLEFDFTSQNQFMSFNFLFASDEYGTFQCNYSDAFAFLLTDLVTGITTNLAVVPNTTIPISVVTIRDSLNNSSCTSVNSEYFGTFYSGNSNYQSATNFNGQTVKMTASSTIIPNNPYHIKLVIADRGDTAYDSAVFIEAGSFASGPPECSDRAQLIAFIDANSNGIKDANEINFTYGSFVYQQNNVGEVYSVSSPFGVYNKYDANPLNTYDFNYQINSEYAPYFSVATTNYNDVSIAVGSGTQTYYFPITLTQGFNDVSVNIVPMIPPRPGFTYTNKVVYKNLGITPASGTLTFNKAAQATIVNVNQQGIVTTATGFTFDYTNLLPYETRTLLVTMSVPAIPVVNIDDVLSTNASITAPSNDISLANNSYFNSEIVVASYDPNDKMEAHGDKILHSSFQQDDYLFYTIRFQNTGTANAINVRIEDMLDEQLDEQSIRMISASHSYILEKVGNKLVWHFDYIQLPGAVQNEELSKGYIYFKIKLKPGFTVGDIIPNTAQIYFDTNPAIVTNTFTTEFVSTLSTLSFGIENSIIYPNPANDIVQVSLINTSEQIDSIEITDLLGKRIKKWMGIASSQTSIPVSELSKGVYFIEIKTETNLKLMKKLIIN